MAGRAVRKSLMCLPYDLAGIWVLCPEDKLGSFARRYRLCPRDGHHPVGIASQLKRVPDRLWHIRHANTVRDLQLDGHRRHVAFSWNAYRVLLLRARDRLPGQRLSSAWCGMRSRVGARSPLRSVIVDVYPSAFLRG